MRISVLLVLALIILEGCSMNGVYTTNPKSRPAFAGKEIIISKSNKISINSWTDSYTRNLDADGNVIWADTKHKGYGTFTKLGDSLEVTFLNEDSLTITIDKKGIGERKYYTVNIKDELGNVMDPFISLQNSSAEIVQRLWEQNKPSVGFNTSPRTEYASIGFEDMTMFSPTISIPIKSIKTGQNIFKFKTYAGYYGKGDKIRIYCKRTPTGIRYGPKRRWLAKKYKSTFLNRFYK